MAVNSCSIQSAAAMPAFAMASADESSPEAEPLFSPNVRFRMSAGAVRFAKITKVGNESKIKLSVSPYLCGEF